MRILAQHRTMRNAVMPHRIHVFLLLLHLAVLLPVWTAGMGQLRKKASRTRPCLDLPEEILEQMFGRLSVGVMSAFHHALQLEPQDKLNRTCPTTVRPPTDSKTRLPVNLLSVSPWAYRISYDPARYPRYIPEAYCLCKGCLVGPYGEESDQYRSAPVYAPSVLLRRTGSCVGGRHSYTEIYVSVAVGCTCVPLPEKERDGQTSNQSLEGRGPKARQLFSVGKKA
ncbi:interleukin-17D [Embiotoca jacksoni]|uniref:interleukin-17D n=1 Tax=Embiotoca jacksoni TaxID=100190 RepID=UPI0037045E1B